MGITKGELISVSTIVSANIATIDGEVIKVEDSFSDLVSLHYPLTVSETKSKCNCSNQLLLFAQIYCYSNRMDRMQLCGEHNSVIL